MGFPKLCAEIGRLWREDRARMGESADKVMAHLRAGLKTGGPRGGASAAVFGDFIDRCEAMFDPPFDNRLNGFPLPRVPRIP
jgi:uncharacterized protein YyaL (SSP411 family)